MQSGDGLLDVASAVYVVAGPEEDRQIRPACSLLFVCCAVCYALLFCFYLYRVSIRITAHTRARARPPGYQGHRHPAPRYISLPHTRFWDKKGNRTEKDTPVHREVRHKGVLRGKGRKEEDSFSIVQSQIEFKRSIE